MKNGIFSPTLFFALILVLSACDNKDGSSIPNTDGGNSATDGDGGPFVDCETDPCQKDPCAYGSCTVSQDCEAVCVCDDGYAGEICDRCDTENGYQQSGMECVKAEDDPCFEYSCGEHGSCIPDGSEPACECDKGWTGELCDGCAEPLYSYDAPADRCVPCNELTFTYQDEKATTVELAGSFTGWATNSLPMTNDGTGLWSVTTVITEPGKHLYKFVVDGEWIPDPNNDQKEEDGYSSFNSIIEVCDLLPCDPDPCDTDVTCGENEECKCDPDSGDTSCVCAPCYTGADCTECAGGCDLVEGDCVPNDDFDWRDAVMYFVMVDRFFDGDSLNNDSVDGVDELAGTGCSARYKGGDFVGVTKKLSYISELGATAIWLNPPFENRNTKGKGINDDYMYSGYHGYWPSPDNIDYSDPDNPVPVPKVESRFGTAAELKSFVEAAHSTIGANGSGLKVLFDYVMNHVDEESGLYKAKSAWFRTDILCPPNNWDHETWGTRCAFTSYLPSFQFEDNPDAIDWSVADALWWAKEYDIDGYRLDAIKHVPMTWLTELRSALNAGITDPEGGRFYLVGETFDYENKQKLKDFIDPATKLDGQYDFPLKYRLCEAIFMDGRLDEFSDWMDSNDGFYGSNAIMTTWIGNHDIPRAIHFASGQIDNCRLGSDTGNSWLPQSYGQPEDAAPYEKLGLAFAVLMSSPGIPLIYYGDEVGLAGGGDPDNRRMMPWNDKGLKDPQKTLRQTVTQLANIRGQNKALSRGSRTELSADDVTWVYRMSVGAGVPDVIVALNKDGVSQTVTIPTGNYTDLVSGKASTGGSVKLQARSFVFLREE